MLEARWNFRFLRVEHDRRLGRFQPRAQGDCSRYRGEAIHALGDFG